jgi:hypothetical protein
VLVRFMYGIPRCAVHEPVNTGWHEVCHTKQSFPSLPIQPTPPVWRFSALNEPSPICGSRSVAICQSTCHDIKMMASLRRVFTYLLELKVQLEDALLVWVSAKIYY